MISAIVKFIVFATLPVAGLLPPVPARAAGIELEWNHRHGDSGCPHELELDRNRLQQVTGIEPDTPLAVIAADAAGTRTALPLRLLAGSDPGREILRFEASPDSRQLFLEPAPGKKAPPTDSERVDNLFAEALSQPGQWRGENLRITPDTGGIRLEAVQPGPATAGWETPIPTAAAGKPVKFELDVCSLARLTWGSYFRIAQFDANGRELGESVIDPRWISHLRPPQVWSRYRTTGRIHPEARKLRLELVLLDNPTEYDNFGKPLTDPADRLPRLLVGKAALRIGAELPFPRRNSAIFAPGISGTDGDFALRLDGQSAFIHVTTSQASWSEEKQIRDPQEWFWPTGDGTVEAWFRPELPADGDGAGTLTLMDAANCRNSINGQYLPVRGSLLTLTWNPETRRGTLLLKDGKDRTVQGDFELPMQNGGWHHLAVQWSGKTGTSVWLDGRRCFADASPVAGINVAAEPLPSTRMAQNFTLGMPVSVARGRWLREERDPKYRGEVDLLRISSIARYDREFEPSRTFDCDADTRALYDFDRSFDGVSGGGMRFMRGTFDSPEPLSERRISFNGRRTDWFPAQVPDHLNPDLVLDKLNYPRLPNHDSVRMARTPRRETFRLLPGETAELTVAGTPFMDYVEIAAAGTTLRQPIILNSGEVDSRSFGDIAVSMGLDRLPEYERVLRLFNFVLKASDYFSSYQVIFPPDSDRPQPAWRQALTMLNGYCGFNCGPLNDMTANLLSCSGNCPAVRTYGFGHSFQQVFYQGGNHLFDLSAQKFFPSENHDAAVSLEELESCCGALRDAGSAPDNYTRLTLRRQVRFAPAFQKRVAYDLHPGESMRFYFCNNTVSNDLHDLRDLRYNRLIQYVKTPAEAQGDKLIAVDFTERIHSRFNRKIYQCNRVFPHYSSAFLRFEGRPTPENPAFDRKTDRSFCYRVELPYTVVGAVYRATAAGQPVPLSLSTDGGRTFRPLKLDAAGAAAADYEVRGRHGYWVRIEAPLESVDRFSASTQVMLNSRIQTGRLHEGLNKLLFKADSAAPAQITIGYRTDTAPLEISGGATFGTLPGRERQLIAVPAGNTRNFSVTGASDKTAVRCFGPLRAKFEQGILEVTAEKLEQPAFGAVILDDCGAQKTVTVLIAPEIRLITADAGLTPGAGAEIKSAAGSRLQDCVAISRADQTAKLQFAPLRGGSYQVWMLLRARNRRQGMPLARLTAPGMEPIAIGRETNCAVDFFKARYGREEFGRLRWDCPINLRDTRMAYYSPQAWKLPDGCSEMTLSPITDQCFEIAALLIVSQPDHKFMQEMIAMLAGLNPDPWLIEADRMPSVRSRDADGRR